MAKIGEILVQHKLISSRQLDHAVEVQKKTGGVIGEVMVELGYVSETQLFSGLMSQLPPEIQAQKNKQEDERPEHMGQEFSQGSRRLKIDVPQATGDNVIGFLDGLLGQCREIGASDIHFEAFEKMVALRARVDGVLFPLTTLSTDFYGHVLRRIQALAEIEISETRSPQDGHFRRKLGKVNQDFRVSILPCASGSRTVLRLLGKADLDLGIEQLGLRKRDFDKFKRELDRPNGLILVTGPTGSGKTTTLYSAVKYLNKATTSIITIEDPVEVNLQGISQCQVHSKIDFTFAKALRSVLRQDPNVIMVGEIRDEETADIAVRASLTGHLVLATAHTNDAPSAVARMTNMGVKPYMIASSLNMVIAQRLVRRVCTNCRSIDNPSPETLLRLGLTPKQIETTKWPKGSGCNECHHTGYKGRVPLFQTLIMSQKLRDIAGRSGTAAEILKQARRERMTTLALDGLLKAREGLTTIDEVMQHAYLSA